MGDVSSDAIAWLLIITAGLAFGGVVVWGAIVLGAVALDEIEIYFARLSSVGGDRQRARWREDDAANDPVAVHDPLAGPETMALASGNIADPAGAASHG